MVLVHNHPSGNLEPSQADKDFTDRLLKVGQLINIEVLDHLIITEESFTSFANEGIIKELKKSGLYEIVDREKAHIKEWQLQSEKKQVNVKEKCRSQKSSKSPAWLKKRLKR